MSALKDLSSEEQKKLLFELKEEYKCYQAKNIKLNMARGKPSTEQLDLAQEMLYLPKPENAAEEMCAGKPDDVRNYGNVAGFAPARKLMGDLLEVEPEEVIVGGNSSLSLMYSVVSRGMTHGLGGQTPWNKLDGKIKFLCPAPGYDRHFNLVEYFGFELVTVPMTSEGPDMDVVEELVREDETIKGIWCVPKYSNPTGVTYSDETVRRLAALMPAAKDFRIFWDNAYVVHDFTEPGDVLLSIKTACEEAGNPHRWFSFGSMSKITFAGAGIAAIASSKDNIATMLKHYSFQTIGPDKLTQLRHVLFLKDMDGVREHMRNQSSIVAPKFDAVQRILTEGLGGLGVGEWSNPQGGYFISFDGLPHTAKRTVQLAKEAGLVLTPAGATYPYGNDPTDSNIRIAPTYPSLEELIDASKLFVLCVKIAALELFDCK